MKRLQDGRRAAVSDTSVRAATSAVRSGSEDPSGCRENGAAKQAVEPSRNSSVSKLRIDSRVSTSTVRNVSF